MDGEQQACDETRQQRNSVFLEKGRGHQVSKYTFGRVGSVVFHLTGSINTGTTTSSPQRLPKKCDVVHKMFGSGIDVFYRNKAYNSTVSGIFQLLASAPEMPESGRYAGK